jgi:hypothetical protein
MRTRIFLRSLAFGVAALFAVTGAFGQIFNPRVEVTAGSSMLQASRTFVVNGETFNTQFANGGRGKARFTLDLTKHFSLEGVYGFGTSNLQVTNTTNTPQTAGYGVREHEIQFNALQFFTGSGSHLRPFLTTGLGDAHFTPTSAAITAASSQFLDASAKIGATNQVSVTVGGGIEARSRGRLGLRFDVVDHISAVPNFGLPQTSSGPGGTFYPVSGIVHNIQVEAGIVLYLWRLE